MSSKFKQQMMPAWRPIPSFRVAMTIFILFAIVFIGLGVLILIQSQAIQEIDIPYNQGSDPCTTLGQKCNITFQVTSVINAPVYVFY